MPVQLNHTIVHAEDREAAAAFLTEILGLPAPVPYGPFLIVEAANGVSLDVVADPFHPPDHHPPVWRMRPHFNEPKIIYNPQDTPHQGGQRDAQGSTGHEHDEQFAWFYGMTDDLYPQIDRGLAGMEQRRAGRRRLRSGHRHGASATFKSIRLDEDGPTLMFHQPQGDRRGGSS